MSRAATGILSRMGLYDIPLHTLQGDDSSLGDYAGKTLLVVNVASKCGLTPQYEGLERLQKTYGDRGFSVLGFPCNQFMGQEPGTPEEIQQFCSTTYGVSFPLFEKIEVNGEDRHPLYEELTARPTLTAPPATSPGTSRSSWSRAPARSSGGSAPRSSPRIRPSWTPSRLRWPLDGPPTRSGFAASIFDMDGLLIDSEILWHEAEIEILGDLGVPLVA